MRSVKYWLAAAFTCGFIALSASAVLADASDQQVNDTRAFIEYAFGFSLDAPTVQLIRDGLTSDMAKNESGSLATLNDMNTFMSYVHSHPAASGALLRTYVEPELVAAFQADTSDATSRALVATWRAHNHIVADGRPPLRKDVVDSYIAMFEFISKQAGKQVPAEVKNHSQFSTRVARQYATATPDSQLQFNRVQTLWLALQTIWAQATPAEKAALRQQWRAPTQANAHAHIATASSPAQSGFSGQIFNEEKYKEKLFVDGETQVYMATWTNPFNP